MSGLYAPSPDNSSRSSCSSSCKPLLHSACGKKTGVYALLPLEELVNALRADVRSVSLVNLQMIVGGIIVTDRLPTQSAVHLPLHACVTAFIRPSRILRYRRQSPGFRRRQRQPPGIRAAIIPPNLSLDGCSALHDRTTPVAGASRNHGFGRLGLPTGANDRSGNHRNGHDDY